MGHSTAPSAQVPSFANGNIVIAGDEAQPNTENSSEEDPENSGEDSAKMGKEEGTHTGPNQGAKAKLAPAELYDLENDPGETKDVAGERPEVVKELTDLWTAWNTKNLPVAGAGRAGRGG